MFKQNLDMVVISPKFDGISLRIYITPTDVTCLTRGDVNFGTDITSKCSVIIQKV